MQWMEDNDIDTLPDPALLRECIVTRDFSRFDVKKEDTEADIEKKRIGMALLEDLMDLYTEKLIPAHAGAKFFHPSIRHFESMTTSQLPNTTGEALRIPASTEAMTVLTYMNNHKKWNAMRKWHKENPGKGVHKCPRFSKKKPNENVEFQSEFSDCFVGNAKWGGWSDDGKKLFVTLQKEIIESRQNNFDRHVEIDNECVARLYEKYKDLHRSDGQPNKRQKTSNNVHDNDPAFEFVIEL